MVLAAALVLVGTPQGQGSAQAQDCNRICPGGTPRDGRGCCIAVERSAPEPSRRVAAPCPEGQERTADTAGHCCWPEQLWSRRKKACAGIPSCPVGLRAAGTSCVGGTLDSPTVGTLRYIPPGSFTMGSPLSERGRDDDETPHEVELTRGFWLMEHEVTGAEWRRVMGSSPPDFASLSDPVSECEACPVTMVDHNEAMAFAAKLSALDKVAYRLPTEAEWEYAARAGEAYVFAGSNTLDEVGWYRDNSDDKTHPVCQKKRNAWGLCDMSGNVSEWVADRYGVYPEKRVSDPECVARSWGWVSRGGCWAEEARDARVAKRVEKLPSTKGNCLGFRLARSIP